MCVPYEIVCDGSIDCPTGDDEIECGKTYFFDEGSSVARIFQRGSLIQNNISAIRQRAFDGLANLTWLDLSKNGISQIGSNIFEELTILDGLVLVTEDESDEPIEVDKNGFTGLTSLQILHNHLCLCVCSLMQNTGLRICMWVLGISALLGNFFVIIWRLKQKSARSTTQAVQSFLITNLAVSDFLMGIYMVILASADAYFGEDYFIHSDKWRAGRICKFAGFLSLLSSEASVFFLTLISFDRFLSVVFPFSSARLTIMSAKAIGGGLWGVAFVISIVPVILAGPESDLYDLSDVCVGLPLITRPASYTIKEGGIGNPLSDLELDLPVAEESKPAWYFSIIIFLGINSLCFVVILCCYIAVFVSLKVSAKKVRRRKRDEELKLAVRMAIIVGTDFVCWMPIILMGILSQTGAAVIPLQMYTWTVVLIMPINSSLNPYLYTIAALVSKRHFKVSPEDANAASLVKPEGQINSAPTGTQSTKTNESD
ncbi:G-protein coupled receptor GRL101-like [Amphiura filiformis]|uniref:G-protein coupled receptor GRL101-like n=1 Tax=Amphiura filiformis TaxID=82378 RepID=UPI003B212DE4